MARCIVDMHDPPMGMAALARQVPALPKGFARIEGNAKARQPLNRRRRFGYDKLHGRPVVQPGARNHRVLDMRRETVTGVEYRRDAALRPVGRTGIKRTLGQNEHLVRLRQIDRRRQARSA